MLAERDKKADELYRLRKKTPSDLWIEDLDAFMKEFEVRQVSCSVPRRVNTTCDFQVIERKEREEEDASIQLASKTAKGRKTTKKTTVSEDTKPSIRGQRVEPVIHQKFKTAATLAAKKKKLKEVSVGIPRSLCAELLVTERHLFVR